MTTYCKSFYLRMWFNYHLNPFFLYKQYLGRNVANQLIEESGHHSADVRYSFMQCGIYLIFDLENLLFEIDWDWYKR